VEERANISAKLVHEGELQLSKPVEVSLYHIAQEALNNALKHAAASTVTVRIASNDECVELEVVDDGKGFNPDTVLNKGGMGMISMRERTERMGGALSVESAPGEGTSIRVQVGLS
jgi:signal transduction histidine kinase